MARPKHQWTLLAAIASATAGVYFLHRLAKDAEARRVEDAYRRLDVSTLTPRQIWDAALDLHRAERTQLRADKAELEYLCHEAETVLGAAEAWKRIRRLRDEGTPGFVCVELLAREAESLSASPPFADLSRGLWDSAQQLRTLLAEGQWAALGIDPPDPDDRVHRHWQWALAMSGGTTVDRRDRCAAVRHVLASADEIDAVWDRVRAGHPSGGGQLPQ